MLKPRPPDTNQPHIAEVTSWLTHLSRLPPSTLGDNVFQVMGRDAMLITAGTSDHFNTMTASWGGWGHLSDHSVTFSFVRPQRHTFSFMGQAESYTLCFFNKERRQPWTTAAATQAAASG